MNIWKSEILWQSIQRQMIIMVVELPFKIPNGGSAKLIRILAAILRGEKRVFIFSFFGIFVLFWYVTFENFALIHSWRLASVRWNATFDLCVALKAVAVELPRAPTLDFRSAKEVTTYVKFYVFDMTWCYLLDLKRKSLSWSLNSLCMLQCTITVCVTFRYKTRNMYFSYKGSEKDNIMKSIHCAICLPFHSLILIQCVS